MSKRPEEFTKAQLIEMVGNLESQLNQTYGVDEVPDNAITALITQLKDSVTNVESQLTDLHAELDQRQGDDSAVAALQATVTQLENQVKSLQETAGNASPTEPDTAWKDAVAKLEAQMAGLKTSQPTGQVELPGLSVEDLVAAMKSEDLDQPLYVTMHGQIHDLTEARGVQACREALSTTMAQTGVMLVKILQHRQAQERFQELSSSLPGGGHNAARMAQLGEAIASASKQLQHTQVDGRDISALIGRLNQERGLLDQCIQTLTVLDMETRRHNKSDG